MSVNLKCIVFLVILAHITFAVASDNSTDCDDHSECSGCIADDHCGWCKNERTCKKVGEYCESSLVHDTCPSFFDTDLAIGTILIFFGAILTSGGGIGGGGVYIPILVLVLGFTPHVAVPLSKVTIFGVAVGGFSVLSRKRHPKADRPLIDFDTAFMMEPMTLLGSIIGVYMNMIFPAYLLLIFLVLVIGYSAYKTLAKGVSLYKQEKRAELSIKNLPINEPNENDPLIGASGKNLGNSAQDEQALQKLKEAETKTPWWQMAVLGTLEAGMLVLMLLKGGNGDSVIGVKCATWQYWLIVAAAFPYLGVFTYFVGKYLRHKHEVKVKGGFRYLKEDVQWTYKRTMFLPLLFTFAGIAAGFLGIGAGLVVGPVFLEMGLVPQVAVATSSYMILYTSFSTVIQFLILGRLPWQYAIWYFFVGLFGAIIGQSVLSEIVRRYKKQAFINFLLGSVIALSVVMMSGLEILNLYDSVKHHRSMGFQGICHGE